MMNRKGLVSMWGALMTSVAIGAIPMPDMVLHGKITIGTVHVGATDDVVVEARVDGVRDPVGRYRMGDEHQAGDNYVLRMKMEALAGGSEQSDDAALPGQTVKIHISVNGGPSEFVTSVLTRVGEVKKMDVVIARVPGDFDGDGDLDLSDFGRFQMCFTGPDSGPIGPECASGDYDTDTDVDLHDYENFHLAFTGPA